MLEPGELLEDVIAFFQPKRLVGQHVLVTAGPTYEAIDPVRGITNLSSGKMGFAIARAAREAGADGDAGGRAGEPAHAARREAHRREIGARHAAGAWTQRSMRPAFLWPRRRWPTGDPPASAEQKIKKDGSGQTPELRFAENPDILAERGAVAAGAAAASCSASALRPKATTCWPTPRPSARARACRCWWATSARPPSGRTTTRCCWWTRTAHRELPRASKLALARELIAEIALRTRTSGETSPK